MKVGDWIQGSPGNDPKTGQPIPGEVFVIRKDNRRKRDGGPGVIWTCTCPRGLDVIPCAHLRKIYDYAKRGEIPPQLRLTYEGKRAAGRCGCIQKAHAARASGSPAPDKPKRHRAMGHRRKRQHEREAEHLAAVVPKPKPARRRTPKKKGHP